MIEDKMVNSVCVLIECANGKREKQIVESGAAGTAGETIGLVRLVECARLGKLIKTSPTSQASQQKSASDYPAGFCGGAYHMRSSLHHQACREK